MSASYTAGKFKAWADDGSPLTTGRLYTYETGTTTHKNAYTGPTFATPCTYTSDGVGQYIAMNARGEAELWTNGSYTMVLKTAAGATVWSADSQGNTAADQTFTPAGTGAVATTVQTKLRESPSALDKATSAQRTDVAAGSLTVDMTAAIQSAADSPFTTHIPDGSYLLSSVVTLAVPKDFVGNGKKTRFHTTAGFGATAVMVLDPPPATDPRTWTIGNFSITNNGSATHGIEVNVDTAGSYVFNAIFEKIISTAEYSSGIFFKLSNSIPNQDGFFVSVVRDNLSFGGYYLDNIGDTISFSRNKTGGTGVGYYVNQLGTASHVIIESGNCTNLGGALYSIKSLNLRFNDMQVEVPGTFTGVNDAAVSFDSLTAAVAHQNPSVTNNNINTQANTTLRCIYAEYTNGLTIEGNTLFCYPSTGAHIYIDSNANDTYIGLNKYYRSDTGVELTPPLITDNGIGTRGIWKDATLTLAGWTNQDTSNFHPTSFFKTKDSFVQIRGYVAGGAAIVGDTLFTLPVGFRPRTKAYYLSTSGVVGGVPANIRLQVISTGAVQIMTENATSIYLGGLVFSTL